MKKLITWLSIAITFASGLFPVMAETITDLQKQGRISVETKLNTEGTVSLGEQVILSIEVATDRWFTSGTRIGIPRIPGAIVLQRNKMGVNSISRKNGTNWSHQLWELTIYPQQSGTFSIPAIPVEIEVSSSATQSVAGKLLTKPISFDAALPSGMITESTPWVAARDLSFTQQINIEEGQTLEVGDAIEREITFDAKDTTSMLFPLFEFDSPKGTKAYVSSPENSDSSVRGLYSAKRTQKISYIVQDSGEIDIPELKLYWWDVDSKALEEVLLPAIHVHSKHTLLSWIKSKKEEIVVTTLIFILLLLIRNPLKRLYYKVSRNDTVQFMLAVFRKDRANANKYNYRKAYQSSSEFSFSCVNNISKSTLKVWEKTYAKSAKPVSMFILFKLRRNIIRKKSNKCCNKKDKQLKWL